MSQICYERPANSNGLVIIKSKRKLEYCGHVLIERVRPVFLEKHFKLSEN